MKGTLSTVLAALVPIAAAPAPIHSLLSTKYLPHRFYFLAQPWLIWSNVAADSLTALAYVAIFLALLWLGSRIRHISRIHGYLWICASFGSFLIACAATDLMETVTMWQPVYRLFVLFKILCALVSVVTACLVLWRMGDLSRSIRQLFEHLDLEHAQGEALRKSEALLDRTNRIAGIGGWEFDVTTNEVSWSGETARLHGMHQGFQPTLEQGIQFFAPECRQAVRDALQRGIESGSPWDLEVQIDRADGRRIWVRLVGDAECVDGKPVRLFGSVQDKTAEVEQREAIRKSGLLLDRCNRVSGMGSWELDLVTNAVTWSAQTAHIHGLKPGYKPTLEEGINYFARSGQPTLHELMQKAMEGGGGWDVELTLIRADGSRRQVRHLGDVEFLNGKPIKLFGSLQDITREIEQREALRKAQLFLDRTNRVAGIGGWEFDLNTKELLWSDQTARIHGMPPGHQPTLEESFAFFPAEYHPSIAAAIDNALATGVGYEFELPLLRPDGSCIWVHLVGEVEWVDGKPVRIFGSLQDKTFEVEQREALRKSQLFLDRTNRIAGVGGWEIDIATGDITWSAETYRIHGLPATYVPSLATGLSFYAEHERPKIAAAVELALETGEAWDLELQFIRADDKPIWVRTTGNVEMHNGRPVRIVGAVQEKTAQVNARLALKAVTERVTLAADSGGIGVWDWDIPNNALDCDALVFKLYGYEPLDGPTSLDFWADRFHPDDRAFVVQAINDAVKRGKPYDTEFRVVWLDGSVHHLKATGKVTLDDSGRPVRMVGTNRDVTEARRLAAELEKQHELLRVTLLSIGDAVISQDVQHDIVWMNSAAERMTGWTAAEASRRPVNEVFHPIYSQSRESARDLLDFDIDSITRISIDESLLLLARDGVERNIECFANPIRDTVGQLLGSVLVIRDVTEQFRLTCETEQINKLQFDLKLKDEFLSHVSHELRSPLTSVYSFTSIIADNLAGETTDEQQQFLGIILKNVLQLQSMIEDLLTVTQSKEGKLPIDLQPVAIAPAILDAIHTAYPTAAAKQISISSRNLDNPPFAWSDPTRLRQVMIILLDNAVKFTPEGGMIDVRVFEEEDMLRFEVEDNGCGIPIEKRARIFEKLYQITAAGHADTSQQGRIGLGLGLHIARDLIRRQGGNIWVSGDPERGSIFNFTLPVFSDAISAAALQDVTPRRRSTDLPESVAKQLNPAA